MLPGALPADTEVLLVRGRASTLAPTGTLAAPRGLRSACPSAGAAPAESGGVRRPGSLVRGDSGGRRSAEPPAASLSPGLPALSTRPDMDWESRLMEASDVGVPWPAPAPLLRRGDPGLGLAASYPPPRPLSRALAERP